MRRTGLISDHKDNKEPGADEATGASELLRFSLSHLLMNLLARLLLMRKCIFAFIPETDVRRKQGGVN